MIEDSFTPQAISDPFGFGSVTRRDYRQRELRERVSRGEYWVDLDFLAGLLVDSKTVGSRVCRDSRGR